MSRESIRERLAAATPGPWLEMTYGHRDTRSQVRAVGRSLRIRTPATEGLPMTDLSWVHQGEDGPNVCLTGNGPKSWDNGQLIAHAPTDLAALLAVADAAVAFMATRPEPDEWDECEACALRAALTALEGTE